MTYIANACMHACGRGAEEQDLMGSIVNIKLSQEGDVWYYGCEDKHLQWLNEYGDVSQLFSYYYATYPDTTSLITTE